MHGSPPCTTLTTKERDHPRVLSEETMSERATELFVVRVEARWSACRLMRENEFSAFHLSLVSFTSTRR